MEQFIRFSFAQYGLTLVGKDSYTLLLKVYGEVREYAKPISFVQVQKLSQAVKAAGSINIQYWKVSTKQSTNKWEFYPINLKSIEFIMPKIVEKDVSKIKGKCTNCGKKRILVKHTANGSYCKTCNDNLNEVESLKAAENQQSNYNEVGQAL